MSRRGLNVPTQLGGEQPQGELSRKPNRDLTNSTDHRLGFLMIIPPLTLLYILQCQNFGAKPRLKSHIYVFNHGIQT